MLLTILLLAAWTPLIVHPVKDAPTLAMVRAVAREPDPVVRELAAEALTNIAAEASAPAVEPSTSARGDHAPPAIGWNAISERVRPPEPDLQSSYLVALERAVRAAQHAGDRAAVGDLVRLLDQEDEGLRQAVCEALGTLLTDRAEPLVSRAVARRMSREPSYRVLSRAGAVLRAMHDPLSRDLLQGLLAHERFAVRAQAATRLGEWADPALAAVLIPLLQDDSSLVAGAAAEALGRLGNRLAEQPLLAVLAADREPVTVTAIEALGRLRSRTAVPALLSFATGINDTVGAPAVLALRAIGDRRAVPAWESLIQHISYLQTNARREAIRGLGAWRVAGLTARMVDIVTKRVVPPPPMSPLPLYDSTEARVAALAYLADFGTAAAGEQLRKGFVDTPPAAMRPALAETVGRLTGARYDPQPDETYRHYFVESLGPAPYPGTPPPPGIVPAEEPEQE